MGAQHVAKHGKLCKSLNHQVDLQITRATCLPNHLAGQDCIAATGRTERRLVRAMAGFDEGAVFYNDGYYRPAEDSGIVLSRREAQIKFEEFLRRYHGPGAPLQQKYADALLENKKFVRVDLQDLKNFDSQLGRAVAENPSEYLPVLEAAALRQLQQFHIHEENGEGQDFTSVQVLLYSSRKFGPEGIRQLVSDSVAHLVMIPGIITSAARPKHKATHMTIMCKECKDTKTLVCNPGKGGALIPRACSNQAAIQTGGDPCGLDPFVILPAKSKYVDQQELKLQEQPEDVPTGELPRSVTLLVDRQLVGKVSPGTRVVALGIHTTHPGNTGKGKDRGAVALQQAYLRVVGLEEDLQGSHSLPTFTAEEEADFKEFAARPRVFEDISGRVARQIFGHKEIKQAVACLLFGGARKKLPDGTHRRGDINVLLLGDPSTAKSQFLKYASKTAPIAVYTSGKGSSAAGLTASVIRDANGEFYLEGGAMVLADNGVVCIDEFDKMRPEDRVAIHEAMEQQTISIAKAGITTMLKSRTSVLAAANPPSGKYDDLKSAQDNIDLQSTILSRFDLIFIVKDERTMETDKQIARHVLGVHRDAGSQQGEDEDSKREEAFFKRYLEYCRTMCAPRLSQQAGEYLVNEYVGMRGKVRQAQADKHSSIPAIPVTVRQLEAVIRISESIARMQLLPVATQEHVAKAIQLFNFSTMEAVKSGLHDNVTFSDEQKAEMVAVEAEIKRRIAIGATVSERRIREDIARIGMSEAMVARTVTYLVTRGSLEFRHGRRSIYRKE